MAGGPPAPRRQQRQQRAGATARGLRELARGAAAGDAGEARGPPARLLQGEALHGAADADVDHQVSLLGGEDSHKVGLLGNEISHVLSDSPRKRDSDKRRGQELTASDEQVEEAWKSEAKVLILKADSISAMFICAQENIDEDWLGDVDELPGNIYRIAALGTLTGQLFEQGADPSEVFARLVRLVGFFTIFLIQICGPPLLIASVYFDWGVRGDHDVNWSDWDPSFSDFAAINTTKVLSNMFMFVFTMNGLHVTFQEKQAWLKIYNTFRYLKTNTPNMDVRGEPWLILGTIVKSWVTLLTCIASFAMLGASFSPRNLLLEILGLLFLYNLDEIDGHSGFVSTDDWDGRRLGWIYREMVETNYRNSNVSSRESQFYDHKDVGRTGRNVLRVYDTVSMLLVVSALVMPVVAFATPFLAIVPEGFD